MGNLPVKKSKQTKKLNKKQPEKGVSKKLNKSNK